MLSSWCKASFSEALLARGDVKDAIQLLLELELALYDAYIYAYDDYDDLDDYDDYNRDGRVKSVADFESAHITSWLHKIFSSKTSFLIWPILFLPN